METSHNFCIRLQGQLCDIRLLLALALSDFRHLEPHLWRSDHPSNVASSTSTVILNYDHVFTAITFIRCCFHVFSLHVWLQAGPGDGLGPQHLSSEFFRKCPIRL